MPEQTNISPQKTNTNQAVAESLLPQYAENQAVEQKNNLLTIQPKLTIGSPDDPYEREADSVANHVMRMPMSGGFLENSGMDGLIQRKCASCDHEEGKIQRKEFAKTPDIQLKCAACEHEEESIQRKPFNITPFIQKSGIDGGGRASDAVSNKIESSRGGGSIMSESSRSFMESRFGMDFSGVKIHTDSNASQLSQELNAQAFTVGSDIYFNEGKYNPDSDSGRHLLAHELTHTIQQSPSIQQKKIKTTTESIQRSKTFGPPKRPSGTNIHTVVLPMFVASNTDLFIEAPIPGANKDWLEQDKKGRADFFKGENPKAAHNTIGLTYDTETFKNLSGGAVEFGGSKTYNHNTSSAPRVVGKGQKIKKVDEAPSIISVGDLKPGASSEGVLGSGNQLPNYQSGIKNTADALNKYLDADPTKGTPKNAKWNLKDVSNITTLTIPPVLTYPTGKGIFPNHLAVYNGETKASYDSGLTGALFVYKDSLSGIWSYEWFPKNIPASTGNSAVNEVLNRLNSDVIPNLTNTVQKPTTPIISPKRLNNIALKSNNKIQKKDEKFNASQWNSKHYNPWKKEADTKVLSNSSEKDKVEINQALVEQNKRTGNKLNLPTEVESTVSGYEKIKHWNQFGGIYGWFREKFDFIFKKVAGFAKKIKTKVANFLKKTSSTGFGNWVKAAAKVIFKIFKMVGSWVVTQTLDRLVQSLQEGLTANFKKLVESFTPDAVKHKIEEFEALKQKYEDLINEKEEELEKKLFGDKLELFDKLETFEAIADTVSTIVSLVKWGIRLLACASPPAIGCLWNLAIEALQVAFALLMETCWFTKKVYEPIMSNVDLVRNYPAELASKIVPVANSYLPVPDGFDPFFAPISIDYSSFKVECGEGGGGSGKYSAERAEILNLMEEIGEEKFNALMELMVKKGAGPWLLITPERLSEIRDMIKDVSTDDLKNTLAGEGTTPVPLATFMENIKKYSKKEVGTKKKFFEDKAAREAKMTAEKGNAGGGTDAGTGHEQGSKKGEGDGVSYKIIKTPIVFDNSKPQVHTIQDLTINEEKSKVVTGGDYTASVNVSINGNLINVPNFRIHIDLISQLLAAGEQPSPTYHITITEIVNIEFSTGEKFKLNGMNISETLIIFTK